MKRRGPHLEAEELLLRPSKALDALRRARLFGTLRDVIVLVIGAGLVASSSKLTPPQEVIIEIGGAILMATGIIFLGLRQYRSYRTGIER